MMMEEGRPKAAPVRKTYSDVRFLREPRRSRCKTSGYSPKVSSVILQQRNR